MNPHPAGQQQLNVPMFEGERLPGVQHKYRETVLFFPTAGQTCHSYCSYCFRWAQFVGLDDMKFASKESAQLKSYLKTQPDVTSVLFTGGDPMVMRAQVLRRYIEPLLTDELPHVESIRIGTKSPVFWPQRFVSDSDADDILRLFDDIQKSGRNMALMVHYSHPRELSTPVAEKALKRILSTGATVRCQAPLIRHVNDDAQAWADLWRKQVRLGAVPYYMFVERDTGAKKYFEVPLERALNIFNRAYQQVSGLARTVRGPSMSATPGKVLIDGRATVMGEDVFVLKFLQARDPAWVGKPFFAKFDPKATWLDDLRPAFGEREFFFEPGLRAMTGQQHGNQGHHNHIPLPVVNQPMTIQSDRTFRRVGLGPRRSNHQTQRLGRFKNRTVGKVARETPRAGCFFVARRHSHQVCTGRIGKNVIGAETRERRVERGRNKRWGRNLKR